MHITINGLTMPNLCASSTTHTWMLSQCCFSDYAFSLVVVSCDKSA